MKLVNKNIFILLVMSVGLIGGALFFRSKYSRKPVALADNSLNASQTLKKQEFIDALNNVKSHPNDIAAHKKLADLFAEQNLMQMSVKELNIVLKLDPKDDGTREKVANIFFGAKQYGAAEIIYRDLTIRNPRSVLAWQGLAATLEREGRHLESIHVANKCIEIEPDNPSTHLLMAKATLEYALQFPAVEVHSGELEIASHEFVELAKTFPTNADIQYNLGRTYLAMQEKEKGLLALRAAHSLSPRNQEFGQMLVIEMNSLSRFDEAMKVTRELLSYAPDAPPTNDLYGLLLLKSKEPNKEQKAIQAFTNAVNHEPNNLTFLMHLADAEVNTGQFASAKQHFEAAVRVNPNHPYPYQRLALIYTRLGDRTAARIASKTGARMEENEQQLKRLQELSQNHFTDVNLHLILADRYRDLHKMGPARDEYLTVLKLDPNNKRVPKALLNGAHYFKKGGAAVAQ